MRLHKLSQAGIHSGLRVDDWLPNIIAIGNLRSRLSRAEFCREDPNNADDDRT